MTAEQLIKNLNERGRHGEVEWQAYEATLEDLRLTLIREPLDFEDALAMALVAEGWTTGEAWSLVRQARSLSSKSLRLAIEAEQCLAHEAYLEARGPRDYDAFDGDHWRKDRELR